MTRRLDKHCEDCGKLLINVTPQKRFCPECKRKHDRRKYYKCRRCGNLYKADGKVLCPECRLTPPPSELKHPCPIICSTCGKIFMHAGGRPPKSCPDCVKKNDERSRARSREAERQAMAASDAWAKEYLHPKTEPRRHQAWESVGRRKNPGINYGKAVAKELLKQQAKEMAERRKMMFNEK